jgi:hypothetical protein
MARDRKTPGPPSLARSLPFVLFSFLHGFWLCVCVQVCFIYSSNSLQEKKGKRNPKVYGDGKFGRRARTRYSSLLCSSAFLLVMPGCVVLTIHRRISGYRHGGIRCVHLVELCSRFCALDSNRSPLCSQCVIHSTLSSLTLPLFWHCFSLRQNIIIFGKIITDASFFSIRVYVNIEQITITCSLCNNQYPNNITDAPSQKRRKITEKHPATVIYSL